MKKIYKLQAISRGNSPISQQELYKSMENLASEGQVFIEIRASEITNLNLEYLQKQGYIITFHQKPYDYYRIAWGEIESEKQNIPAVITILDGIFNLFFLMFQIPFKIFGLMFQLLK